jgi:hypothetical protein
MAKAKIDYEETEIEPTNEQFAELSMMAETYVKIELAIEDSEENLKTLRQKKWGLIRDDLPLLMKHLGMEKFKLDNGIEIDVKDGISVSIAEANKQAAYQWLKDHEAGSLVKGARTILFDSTESKLRDAFDKLWKGKKKYEDIMQVTEGAHTGSLKAFFKERAETEGGIDADTTKLFGIFEYKEAKIKFPKNWDAS